MILVILTIYVLHGSVATQLKCGGMFNNYLIADCPENVPVKSCENRLIFGKVMGCDKEGHFLGHSVETSFNS